MKCNKKDSDNEVLYYQQTNDASTLVDKYHNFLKKYHQLLTTGYINFHSYDLRFFLSTFIRDPLLRKEIRRGKFHSKRCKQEAKRVVQWIQQAFEGMSSEEIWHELIEVFLKSAKKYQPKGTTFTKYLYSSYRHDLRRHIFRLLEQHHPYQTIRYFDPMYHNNKMDEEKLIQRILAPFHAEMEDDFALSHPLWIKGDYAVEPFKSLSKEERLILAKYYYEKRTDKEIGRLLGRHPKSIQRIRSRLIKKLTQMAKRGEIKWIRWQKG
jgi:DNA-directed RNA polymerase specialized sigma24 family protein